MKTYTVSEASKKLGISTRAVQKRCLKHSVRRVNNKYSITEEQLQSWKKEIQLNEQVREPANQNKTVRELTLKVDELTKQNAQLKLEHIASRNYKIRAEEYKLRIKQANERLRSCDEMILDLRNQLAEYDIQPNERIEVFTNENYKKFKQRLREWHDHDSKIKHQEELFTAEKLSLKDMLKHYKNQWKYQRKQSEKILKIHQTLVETIDKQNLNILQRNFIEAKDKGLDNE